MDDKHKLYWAVGIVVAAIVLYLMLRSPSSSSGSSGTILYSTGITPDQAVQLAQAGMSYKLGLAETASNTRINLAGIAAAKDVTNKQTAASLASDKILAALETTLGRYQLQGLESTNASNIDIAKLQSSTLENITQQNRPSAFASTLGAIGSFFSQIGGGTNISDVFKSLASVLTKSPGNVGSSLGNLAGSTAGGSTAGLPGVISI